MIEQRRYFSDNHYYCCYVDVTSAMLLRRDDVIFQLHYELEYEVYTIVLYFDTKVARNNKI